VELFTKQALKTHGLKKGGFTEDAIKVLMDYSFPGNIRELKNLVNKLKRSRIPKSVGGVVAIGGALLLGEASKKSGVADISKETLNAVGEATDFVFKSAFRIGTTVGDIASGDFEGAKKELSRISGYWDQTEAKISHNIDNMVAAWKEKDMSVSTFLSEEGKALKGYYKTAYNAIKNHDFKHDLNVIANETITTAKETYDYYSNITYDKFTEDINKAEDKIKEGFFDAVDYLNKKLF